MNIGIIEYRKIPDSLIKALKDRDAALWIGTLHGAEKPLQYAAELVALPWSVVLCESSSLRFVEKIATVDASARSIQQIRGFTHIIASDPEGTELPPRAMPVFLLNGRDDAQNDSESSRLKSFGAQRRRLNMLQGMLNRRPRTIVIVCNGEPNPIEDFITLWTDEGFRPHVIVLTTAPADAARLGAWMGTGKAPAAIEQISVEIEVAAKELIQKLHAETGDQGCIVRFDDRKGVTRDVDISSCDLVERPLLNRFDVIQSKDLRLLLPTELSRGDMEAFFGRTGFNWKPYAAGLPWPRSTEAQSTLMSTLKKLESSGYSENKILWIISDSGAGGTTLSRVLAFNAASAGYPTLVAKAGPFEFTTIEISRFLYSAHLRATENEPISGASTAAEGPSDGVPERPWLVVFDVEHWEGREHELRTFITSLRSDGRPVVVLVVAQPNVSADLGKNSLSRHIARLTHEMELDGVLSLGDHLNKFLRVHGRERRPHEWQSFWENHRPNYFERRVAHFWIALEFWLKGQIDINQSVQQWLYNSYKEANIDKTIRALILEIAALSIERQPYPEDLIPLSREHSQPLSILLERVRIDVPGLALVRETVGDLRMWAVAHDLLARYLLNAVFYDRTPLDELGLGGITDPIQLRLVLLRRIAMRPELAQRRHRMLAVDFAVRILKLDADGNQEFILYWREVLDILRAMPAGIRQTSRAFNHHIAVSMRRVAKQREFDVSVNECASLLREAVASLEYALNELSDGEADESRLNLFNSLALAYQDLADVEKELGSDPRLIDQLREKATNATRQALEEDPTNPYVLETTAKNLIQQGELYPKDAIGSATEALGYIYQAVSLERSEWRQVELTRLADRALKLLRTKGDVEQMRGMARAGNPLGALAEAWIVVARGIDEFQHTDLTSIPNTNLREALQLLDESALKNNWMLLRFRYDLSVAANPKDFDYQVRVLDELEGTPYRMPLQIQLEHAILLHMVNRHFEANRKFKQLRIAQKRVDAFVEVPLRLFWLISMHDGSKRVCEAQVVEAHSQRALARVRELQEENVPFRPEEFGVHELRAGTKFKCIVNFGRLGPFLKPPAGKF